jgi:hypothetical protein
LPRRGCETVARQYFEATFGFGQRFRIFRVKMVAGIACVIHDDLRSHRRISTARVLPARSNCNRIAGQRMFKNAAQVPQWNFEAVKPGEVIVDAPRPLS